MAEKVEEAEDSECVLAVYCVLESKQISYSAWVVGQLYEDKSLALRARDLIFFTTYLQTVNYYSTIHCWSWSVS